MPVNLSIKGVSDEIADRLRSQAARNHRSPQGELLAIPEESVTGRGRLSPTDLLDKVRTIGLRTP